MLLLIMNGREWMKDKCSVSFWAAEHPIASCYIISNLIEASNALKYYYTRRCG